MATEIKLPELGENVEGGDVVDVKVKAGDQVQAGQALLEVEAEKSTVEVPGPSAGRIGKVLVKKGDKVKTGQTLFEMETASAKGEVPSELAPKSKPKETEETAETASKPAAAKATPPPDKPTLGPDAVSPTAEKPELARKDEAVIPAGPATRRLARELGVELVNVRGSGPGGRVTQEDVKAFVKELAAGGSPSGTHTPVAFAPGSPALPDFGKWGAVEKQPLDAVRRKTAEHMALAWSQIPHVTHHDLADITDLESFRKQQGDRGPKITVTAFALKAVAIALKQFPRCNSSLDLGTNQLILKKYYHLGLAVDSERGLLVPVLRDVDKKSVEELAKEMAEIADRARQKKLSADEMRGGTFTITNIGSIGGTSFTPIVNYPEVAILGMCRSRLQPVYREKGQLMPRLMLPLSLSYDHRVIDGADAARFVKCIVEMLENPLVMLLHA